MSEQETVKVYELAKELGIDSISLLDKLKSLNINVKNHMSDLGEADLRLARSSLGKKSGSASGDKGAGTKKVVARKKATTSTATAAPAAPTPPPAEAASGEKKAASPIIRRRVKADGEVTETITGPVSARLHGIPDSHAAEGAHHAGGEMSTEYHPGSATGAEHAGAFHADTEGGAHQTAAYHGAGASAAMTEEAEIEEHPVRPQSEEVETVSTESPEAPQETTEQPAPEAPQTAASTPTAAPSGAAPSTGAVAAGPATPAAEPPKPARPPIAPFVRPVAPRRSILKIVEPQAPPPRPVIKPAPAITAKPTIKPGTGTGTDANKDNYRIFKKENLDQMVEEEAAKKRGGGGREAEIAPEDVRFADYRKKEMVFLPKRKKIPVGKEIRKTKLTQAAAHKRVVEMKESISVADLASQMSVKASDVVKKLMMMGQMVTMNQSVDFDTATLIATEFQFEVKNVSFNEQALLTSSAGSEDAQEALQPRPPVVTIMGHVDHGKTTLLDAIREANVAAGEAGGITQHIGAYTVNKNGKLITFIDTPGHEAFTVMRARGANVTDIVILVVSADDGVMPQTREALSHAQAAKVPIIVAVNKIDKPGANPEKIKQGLAELNLLAEDWGGETMFVPVSALKKTNIDKLLDSILLQAEVLELKANPDTMASGTVLEARLDKGRGPAVSLLVSRGTLKVGDPIVSGKFAGKVKAMVDHKGQAMKQALPGFACEVLGFEGVPNAGDKFNVTATDADARKVADHRIDQIRDKASAPQAKASLDQLFSKIQAGAIKELEVVLKADVFGSVEAVRDSLVKLSTDKVKVKVIHSAAGGITESDVLLAGASENAIILGFNVRPETKARQIAESEHVEIKCYNIIYELLDDVKKAMTGLLDKKKVEVFLGRAEVRQIFTVPKIGVIAGTAVIDGKMLRGANVRLLRDSRVIFDGKMSSLRRFKDDAKEVAQGYECGIGIENYNDLKPGDLIEAYQIEMVTPELGD